MGTQTNNLQEEWHTFSAEGQQLHYRIIGTGIPLVLLHGFGVSSYLWQATLPYLSAQHQVILVDLPGHGRSSYVSPWRLRTMAPLLAQWLRWLQLPPVALM